MITREQAEEQFYEWALNAKELTRESIENNKSKRDFAETIIGAIQFGRIEFLDDSVKYKLKYEIGGIKELTIKKRILISKSISHQSSNQITLALRAIEAYTETPLAVLNDLDIFDFNRIAAIMSFFG